jgi:hypothetical protein
MGSVRQLLEARARTLPGRDMIDVRGTLADHTHRLSAREQRLDKAAEVIGAAIRDVRALKTWLKLMIEP